MRRKIFALLLAGALCAGLAACGGQGAQETQEETAAAADAAAETDAAASEGAAAGTEEAGAADADAAETTGSGKVTVYMPSPAGLADKLAAAFTEKTGIQVEQFQGTTGEILARLETEEANPVADVVILASWSDGLSMKESGQIMSYTPADADKVNEGWIDEDNMLFGYSASAVGVIYNTTIYPELSADWADLAGADYTDDIAIPDPEKSGACKDFLAGMVTGLDNGEEIMQSWADNGLTVPGAREGHPDRRRRLQRILLHGRRRASGYLLSGQRHGGKSPSGHDYEHSAQRGQRQGLHRLPVQRRGAADGG